MPLLRKAILKPMVGLNYMDPSTMLQDRGGFPKNMRLYRNYLKKREGKSYLGSVSISPLCNFLYQYVMESMSIRLIRFSKKNVEKYNTTTATWTDITGNQFTGDDTDFYSVTVAEDKMIITNNVDAMRCYADGAVTYILVADTGTVPKAKFVEYNPKGYLVAAYTNAASGGPTMVQWTNTGNIYQWGSGNYGSSLLRHSPNPIRGLKNLNEYTVAYKKDAIYLGRPVDTSDIFLWDLAYTGVGLASNRAIVDYRGVHYFMGIDDFYMFNGARPESIASDTVKKEVFQKLDLNKTARSLAVLVEDYDEIWFFVVTSGNDWPTEIWKFNYRTGFWYYDTCSNITAAAIFYLNQSVTVDELIGTVDQQTWRINDSLLTTDYPLVILGDNNGFTYKCNGLVNDDVSDAIDGSWETMDFSADSFETHKRWLQLDFEAKGNNVTVDYSTDFGAHWTNIPTAGSTQVALSGEWVWYRLYFDKVSQYIRFRFRNNTSAETFYIRAYYPYYLAREEVKT